MPDTRQKYPVNTKNQTEPNLLPIAGVRLSAVSAGIKKNQGKDLVLLELCAGAQTAAVFTKNAFCAAPVIIARDHLKQQMPRYLLINSGNANAGTGQSGLDAASACCQLLGAETDSDAQSVLPFSTGVIAQDLPVEKFEVAIPGLVRQLDENNWLDAATGIMTTDTMVKGVSLQVDIDGHQVTVTGIAKGSGMIRPDMATMLAYIATDANVESHALQHCLQSAVAQSFNRITVDGDTSTNDACVLVATGAVDMPAINDLNGNAGQQLISIVTDVCQRLAKWVIRDGEGATKFVTVLVEGGESTKECEDVAYTIAHSPLVKTAMFASDPNWGRILAAVGRAGVKGLDINAIQLYLDDVCIVRDGGRAPEYREEQGQQVFSREEFTIRVVLGRGVETATVWTCDFSYDYVRINAEYRS